MITFKHLRINEGADFFDLEITWSNDSKQAIRLQKDASAKDFIEQLQSLCSVATYFTNRPQ